MKPYFQLLLKTFVVNDNKSPRVLSTVVGDNINIMKTTFELNFNFYQAFKIFFLKSENETEFCVINKFREKVNFFVL